MRRFLGERLERRADFRMIFCWSGVSLFHVSFEMTSGSNMNQTALLRAVVTPFAFSDSRNVMSDVLDVIAASSTPLFIAL